MNGLHLIADLHDCRCPTERLLDLGKLEHFCVDACRRHGLTVVGQLFHAFLDAAGNAAGVTGVVILAESHLAIHTWPERSAVTLDVYVCNFSDDNSGRAQQLFAEVSDHFDPAVVERHALARGILADGRTQQARIQRPVSKR